MVATAQNARIRTAQNAEVHRRRIILNRTWDMQILYIAGEGYQATYYECNDSKVVSKCYFSASQAAFMLDQMVNRMLNIQEYYVQIGFNTPVPFDNLVTALSFCHFWNGQLIADFRTM